MKPTRQMAFRYHRNLIFPNITQTMMFFGSARGRCRSRASFVFTCLSCQSGHRTWQCKFATKPNQRAKLIWTTKAYQGDPIGISAGIQDRISDLFSSRCFMAVHGFRASRIVGFMRLFCVPMSFQRTYYQEPLLGSCSMLTP